jgi:hypothetical protein
MSLPDSKLADPTQRAVLQKPQVNVYTAMLGIALVAIFIGCLCLVAELNAYNWEYPK